MDDRDEVKAFLDSRRATLTPEQAGLTRYNRNRRVPDLRRSEVAGLAGVGVEYYAQLERGNFARAADSVLDALARALHLDEAERAHLADLAGPAARGRRTGHPPEFGIGDDLDGRRGPLSVVPGARCEVNVRCQRCGDCHLVLRADGFVSRWSAS